MNAWQPIKTAPNDFTEVLVWDGRRCWLAEQSPYGVWSSRSAYALDDRAGEDAGFYVAPAEDAGLTHWMPLPPPPAGG